MDTTEPKKKDVRRIVAIGAGVVGALVGMQGYKAWSNSPTRMRANLEEVAKKEPAIGAMYEALKRDFPEEYEKLVQLAIDKTKAGATPQQAYESSFTEMQSFVAPQMKNVARASTPTLLRFVTAQREAMAAFGRVSPELCAKVASGRLSPVDKVPKETYNAISALTVVTLDAAREGIDHPVSRPAATVTASDAQALFAKVKEGGATDDLVARLSSPTGLTGAPPAVLCDGTQRIAGAIAALPSEQAAKWVSYMMTQS